MPPRRPRAQDSQLQVAAREEVAVSVLAEQNPPPSLLDAIMEKILIANSNNNQQGDNQHDNNNNNNNTYDPQTGMMVNYGGGGGGGGANDAYSNQQQHQPSSSMEPPRHPERPVLSQIVLCGTINTTHCDGQTVRNFLEEASATATGRSNETDPLKGRMYASADALAASHETMRVIGTFTELPKHFWAVLEAEPAYLHEALREILSRLQKGRALEKIRIQQQQLAQQQSGSAATGGGGGATASKTQLQQQQQQQQQLLQQMQQQGAFDGIGKVQIAFYADDVIERMTQKWITIDLTDAPTAIAGNQAPSNSHLDEYVVDSVQSLSELASSMQSSSSLAGGGGGGLGLGGVRGISSAFADTARLAKLATLTLPRDDITEKMRDSGLFFSLEEFVLDFCTEKTGVPSLNTAGVHPIEPELEY